MNIEIESVVPMLQVRDVNETVEFYTGTLGFAVNDILLTADGDPYWCSLSWGSADLMFYARNDESVPEAMSGVLYFNPSDVEALWEQLKDAVEIAWPLQLMDYGMVEFAIKDPNGYTLSFGQPAAPGEEDEDDLEEAGPEEEPES